MKLLSIDVGIKNLSFCLFEIADKKTTIVSWNNINLTEKETALCCYSSLNETNSNSKKKKSIKNDDANANEICNKPAKFKYGEACYCLKHAKKVENVIICRNKSIEILKFNLPLAYWE